MTKHYDHTYLIEASFGPTQLEINCRLPLIDIHLKNTIEKQFKDTSYYISYFKWEFYATS